MYDPRQGLSNGDDSFTKAIQLMGMNQIQQEKQQGRSDAKSLGDLLKQNTTISGYTHNGKDTTKTPEGLYVNSDGVAVPESEVVPKYNTDLKQAMIQGLQQRIPGAVDLYKNVSPSNTLDYEQRMNLLMAGLAGKKEKDKDLKPRDIAQTMLGLDTNNFYTKDKSDIFTALNAASDDPDKFDATISAINTNTDQSIFRHLVPGLPLKNLDTSGFTQAMQNYKPK